MTKRKPREEHLDGDARTGSMVVRGHEIQESRSIYLDGMPVSDIIEELKVYNESLNDATIQIENDPYEGYPSPHVIGFREMTPEEEKRAEKLREKIKARNEKWKKERLEYERREYTRLKEKFEKE